jgi:hypothetical protein
MQTVQNNLVNVLTRAGVLINLGARYWHSTKKLNPEDLCFSLVHSV